MNKKALIPIPAALALCLSGCSAGLSGISSIYLAAVVLAAVMLVFYCFSPNKKSPWFMVLFCSVLIVNTGYLMLSMAKTLELALWANRLAYLGSVFLPLSMLMIVLHTARIRYKNWLPPVLLILAGLVFALTATQGWLPIYYKDAQLVIVDGTGTLDKVYGPLHCVYHFYLFGYFAAMVASVIYVNVKKKLDSVLHAAALTVAVFVNLGVWFIEQLVHNINFEMLALSYIISEMFILVLDRMGYEQDKLKDRLAKSAASAPAKTDAPELSRERAQLFREGIASLTQTEKLIFTHYTQGLSTKQIMEQLHITENTLKFHNKNIYSKLGVNSRKQLLLLYRQINE